MAESRELTHQSERDRAEAYDHVAPAGARIAIDKTIGICLVHGWWFSIDGQRVVACPEPDCKADIQLYERGDKVRYLDGAPANG